MERVTLYSSQQRQERARRMQGWFRSLQQCMAGSRTPSNSHPRNNYAALGTKQSTRARTAQINLICRFPLKFQEGSMSMAGAAEQRDNSFIPAAGGCW